MDIGKIDKTIDALCERIIAETKKDCFNEKIPDTIVALVELLSARALFQNMTNAHVQETANSICREIAEQICWILPATLY